MIIITTHVHRHMITNQSTIMVIIKIKVIMKIINNGHHNQHQIMLSSIIISYYQSWSQSAIITLCLIQDTCRSIKLRSLTAKICIRHNIDAAVACVKIYSNTVARNWIAMKENVKHFHECSPPFHNAKQWIPFTQSKWHIRPITDLVFNIRPIFKWWLSTCGRFVSNWFSSLMNALLQLI